MTTKAELAKTDAGGATPASSHRTELAIQVAKAMANEFNNVMMAVTACAELEIKSISPTNKRNLEQILAHSNHATFLVRALLSFLKEQEPAPGEYELNPIVADASKLLKLLVSEEMDVTLHLDSRLGMVWADPIELQQLVLGLALFMRDVAGRMGSFGVSTELIEAEPAQPSSQKPQLTAQITMEFSPEPSAQGENLAAHSEDYRARLMATIDALREVVEQRQGHLRIATRTVQPSTVRICFPALPSKPNVAISTTVSSEVMPSRKTILVVEDDDSVRGPAAEFLMMEGYKVLQARTGEEALRIVHESRSPLHVLVTDISMAGLKGDELAVNLSDTHPWLKVLFMSGDAEKMKNVVAGSKRLENVFLQKPFRLQKLNDKIRELLKDE